VVDTPTGEATQAQLYSYAVEHPSWTPESAADHLGLSLDDIVRAQQALVELRLLQPTDSADRSYAAVSPEIAVADSTHDDLGRIRALSEAVERARSELALFEQVYATARARRQQSDHQIELVDTPATVARVVSDAAARCVVRAYIMHPRVDFRAEMHRASAIYDRELVERGVERRNLYHVGTLSNASTRKAVAELEPIGVKFRTLPVVPVHAIIYDDDLAIISRRSSDDDRAALVIRDPQVVQLARHLYETVWDCATPFTLSASEPAGVGPSPAQQRILEGLAAGLTDEVVARRAGVHVRTVRRNITALCELAGVESRFPLALRARELGWL